MGRSEAGKVAAVASICLAVALALPGATGADSGSIASPVAKPGLQVLPFPGTPDASRRSQIILPAVQPSEVSSIRVRGRSSGVHRGHLDALADGGSRFVPIRQFAPGEQVLVTVLLRSRAAGTRSGAPGSLRLTYGFTVARHADYPVPNPTFTPSPYQPTQQFRSNPGLRPPAMSVSADPDSTSGDLFLAPMESIQDGPMIVNGRGQLVWFHPVASPETATNLAVQSYHRRRVLTYWQGLIEHSHGTAGRDLILDDAYRTVAVVRAGEGYQADLHDFQITPRGTALITAYDPVKADLSSIGGTRDGSVVDGVVQEVDINTGQVLWEWHALGHVPVSATYGGAPTPGIPFDYFHLNSVQELPDGNLLISARNTWAVYELSRQTGRIIWTLGGKYSSFRSGPGAGFEWQHDARLRPDGSLTLLDNAADPREESQSRALQLALNLKTMSASLVHSYLHVPATWSNNEGSMESLPNGNVFVSWGDRSDFSEYALDGGQIFSGGFTAPVQTYRAFRFTWSGRPRYLPAVAVTATGRTASVYASWNGATGIARWVLLAGPKPRLLAPVGTTASTGFETAITTESPQRYFAVRALDGAGHVLSTSAPVRRPLSGTNP